MPETSTSTEIDAYTDADVYANAEEKALTIVPMTTATISFIASSLIIVTIRRSKKKLKDAYRRIVFGMSVFDILSSLAVALKVFKSTPDSTMWLPLGNQTSCDILGFLHIIGVVGTPMYSVNLNVYYYYLVRRNMREEVFAKTVEPWLHGVPIVWSIVGGLYIWAVKMINPSPNGGCFIESYPLGCSKDENVECTRGKNQMMVTVLYLGVPIGLSLIVSLALLIAIWYKVRSQEILMDKYRIRRVSINLQMNLDDFDGVVGENEEGSGGGILSKTFRKVRNWCHRRFRRNRKRTASRSRAFLSSAIWYAVAFTITFTFPYISNIMNLAGFESPFAVVLLSRLLQPLQGLFNILVYTRPHVTSCREIHPEMTWFQAFRTVVKSGGDDDRDASERRGPVGRRSRRGMRTSSRSLRSSSGLSSSMGSINGNHRSSTPTPTPTPTPRRSSSMFGSLKRQGDTCSTRSGQNVSHINKNDEEEEKREFMTSEEGGGTPASDANRQSQMISPLLLDAASVQILSEGPDNVDGGGGGGGGGGSNKSNEMSKGEGDNREKDERTKIPSGGSSERRSVKFACETVNQCDIESTVHRS